MIRRCTLTQSGNKTYEMPIKKPESDCKLIRILFERLNLQPEIIHTSGHNLCIHFQEVWQSLKDQH